MPKKIKIQNQTSSSYSSMWAKYLWRAWHPEQRMRSGEQAQNVRQRWSSGDDARCGAVALSRMRLVPAPRARILQVGCWRLSGGAPRHPPEARAGSYHAAARSGASCSAEADLQSDAVGCRSSTRPAMRRLWHISRRQREWASRAACGCCSAPCTVTARGDAGRSVPLRQGGPCAAGVRTAQHMRCRLPSRTPHRRRVCARHSTRWFLC